MPAHDFQQLRANFEHRVQRKVGILGEEADTAPADAGIEFVLAERQQVFTVEADRTGFDAGPGRQDADYTPNARRFAAARLADEPKYPAALEQKIDMIENLRGPFVGLYGEPQTADLDNRIGHQRARRSRGSTRSRKPSPNRLKPSTASRIANPGKVAYHHASGR